MTLLLLASWSPNHRRLGSRMWGRGRYGRSWVRTYVPLPPSWCSRACPLVSGPARRPRVAGRPMPSRGRGPWVAPGPVGGDATGVRGCGRTCPRRRRRPASGTCSSLEPAVVLRALRARWHVTRRLSVRAGPVPRRAGDADGTSGPGSLRVRAAAAAPLRCPPSSVRGARRPRPRRVVLRGRVPYVRPPSRSAILGSGSPIATGGPLVGTPRPTLVLVAPRRGRVSPAGRVRQGRGLPRRYQGAPPTTRRSGLTGTPQPARSSGCRGAVEDAVADGEPVRWSSWRAAGP